MRDVQEAQTYLESNACVYWPPHYQELAQRLLILSDELFLSVYSALELNSRAFAEWVMAKSYEGLVKDFNSIDAPALNSYFQETNNLILYLKAYCNLKGNLKKIKGNIQDLVNKYNENRLPLEYLRDLEHITVYNSSHQTANAFFQAPNSDAMNAYNGEIMPSQFSVSSSESRFSIQSVDSGYGSIGSILSNL